MRLTIRRLVLLLFLLIVLVWVPLRIYQIRAVESIQESIEYLATEADGDAREVAELEPTLKLYHGLWRKLVDQPSPRKKQTLASYRKRFETILNDRAENLRLMSGARQQAARSLFREISRPAGLYFEATSNAIESEMVSSSQEKQINQYQDQIIEKVNQLHQYYEGIGSEIALHGKTIVDREKRTDVAFLTLSLGMMGLLTLVIWVFVARPLAVLADGVQKVRADRWASPLPVKGVGDMADLIRAFNSMMETLLRQRRILARQARTDELTGLLNYRAFVDQFEVEFRRTERLNRPVSVIIADVDHFKKFNDTQGHLGGNEALKKISLQLRKGCRSYDILARFGGEEFVMVLPETPRSKAVAVAERLRQLVARAVPALTMSCGVATYPEDAASSEELMAIADERLYRAKREGRDRVCSG